MSSSDEFFNHFDILSELTPNAFFDHQYAKKANIYTGNDKSIMVSAISPVQIDILNSYFTTD